MTKKRGSLSSGLTNVVGGMLVGFDEQILRSQPRPEILVKRGRTVRGVSAQGGTLLVGMPDDAIDLDANRPGEDDDDSAQTRSLGSSPASTGQPGE